LSLLLALSVLQGCSKSGSSSGNSTPANGAVRLVNATTVFASLDLTTSGVTLAPAVASGNASAYVGIVPGAYTFSLDLSGSGIPSAQQPLLISSSVNYALVAFTGGQQLRLTALTEIEAAPAAGDGKIRVSNLAQIDSGNVDIYVTANGDLSNASALITKLSGTSGYFEIPQGTYHISVTGIGNKTDLRLDIPVVISDQQVLTLILTSTAGGVLVDGWLLTQQASPQGAVSAQLNGFARVRVAANIPGGSIIAPANGVSTVVSPAVGTYFLVPVPAGTLSMSVSVNGATVTVGPLNAAAGADVTLLAVGTVATPQFFLLRDDNRLPLSGTAKLRLVNGVNGFAGNISLTADAILVAQNVAFGTASVAAPIVTTGNISQLQVTGQGNPPLPSIVATQLTLQSQGVYSVFLLGDITAPVEIVRADR
jgi:hypothetical protein